MAAAAERTGGPGGAGPAPPPPPAAGQTPPGSAAPGPAAAARPVQMNLFATWEVDRSSPACVPRLFSLTLQRLVLLRDAAKEPGNVVIAVKLQGSKRILRSNEIPMAGGGAAEAELQLTFSLQYPHFLKRAANRLQVLLQRRKRYKQRAFLGYKTLAVGLIDMAEVLQQPSEEGRALVLHRALKDGAVPVAEIRVRSVSSQPIDPEAKGKLADRSPDLDNFSEEEDDSFSSDGSDDAMQGQDLFDEEEELPKRKKAQRKMMAAAGRQPNIKQKFVALLKRFKVSEEALRTARASRARLRAVEELAEGLDELCASLGLGQPSDSGADVDDTDSGLSTPRPRLRPFFEAPSHSSSQTEMGSGGWGGQPEAEVACGPPEDLGPDPEGMGARGEPDPHPEMGGGAEKGRGAARGSKGEAASPRSDAGGPAARGGRGGGGTPLRSPRAPKERSRSSDSERSPELSSGPQASRRALPEQLSLILGAEPNLPDCVLLLSGTEWQGQWVSERLQARGQAALCVGGAELQAVLAALLGRIHRLSAPPPRPVKLLAAGPPCFHSCLLRAFVLQLGSRGPDWPRLLRFLLVPLGAPHPALLHLGSLDGRYSAAFLEPQWRELFARSQAPAAEPFNVAARILSYAMGAAMTLALPVAEAMLTCRHKFPDEDSYQKFVPFVGVVKVGLDEDPPPGDGEEAPPPNLVVPSTSPPREAIATPPASPSMAGGAVGPPGDAVGLQVDYWGAAREGAAKSSLRGNFRSLHVSRLPPPGEATPPPGLSMAVVSREKNKKVPTLFLSKRPRDPDPKSLVVDGISRLICSPRPPPALLSVSVDGTQWDDIKFFQLTAQWPSHVKHFPVGLFGPKTS